ncbi:MAG: pyridoxal phosphate-dependent decarboxylase family protein [bacterium]
MANSKVLDKHEWEQLDQYIEAFKGISKQYIEDLESRNAGQLDVCLEQRKLPSSGLDFDACISSLKNEIVPQLSAGRGPRFWAFVTGGATPIATMADWLVSTFDQNVHKTGDSIASLVEQQTVEWLVQLFDLPHSFTGLMTTGGTACNFLGVCTARQYAGQRQGIDVAKDGVAGLDVEFFSTTPHASLIKSMGMAGLGQNNMTIIAAQDKTEKMDVTALKTALEASQSKARIVIASAGTVTATDFDDLEVIADLCESQQAWLHVDGAFGLFERLDGGVEGKTKGIDRADSITVDCHKWLNVPYDCGVFLTRHIDLLEQSFDVPARYLANETDRPDYMSLGVENSRRFRALPVWLTLLAYGREGITAWVAHNIRLSHMFATWIEASECYELSYPCQMNVVLFRVKVEGDNKAQLDKKTKRLMKLINKDGRLFVSPGVWQGQEVIRACISNWQTDEQDVEIAIKMLQEIARQENGFKTK